MLLLRSAQKGRGRWERGVPSRALGGVRRKQMRPAGRKGGKKGRRKGKAGVGSGGQPGRASSPARRGVSLATVPPCAPICQPAKGERGPEPTSPGRVTRPFPIGRSMPGARGCWQIQPGDGDYGPKCEQLLIRQPLQPGLTWCRLQ